MRIKIPIFIFVFLCVALPSQACIDESLVKIVFPVEAVNFEDLTRSVVYPSGQAVNADELVYHSRVRKDIAISITREKDSQENAYFLFVLDPIRLEGLERMLWPSPTDAEISAVLVQELQNLRTSGGLKNISDQDLVSIKKILQRGTILYKNQTICPQIPETETLSRKEGSWIGVPANAVIRLAADGCISVAVTDGMMVQTWTLAGCGSGITGPVGELKQP